jgi:hypothetical protein
MDDSPATTGRTTRQAILRVLADGLLETANRIGLLWGHSFRTARRTPPTSKRGAR